MKKRKIRALTVVLALLLLAGCSQKPGETDPTQFSTKEAAGAIIPTTGQINPVTEPTEATEPTEPPPTLDPVTMLDSIRWKTYPQFLSLGEGNVLACRNYFEEGSGIVNFLDIFNVYEDQVLAQGRNETPRELVEQTFTDGCFVLRDPAEGMFEVYDQSLNLISSFGAPNVDGFFSHDRSIYYFVENRVLYRMDVASGNYGQMALQEELRLESLVSIHPDRNVLCAKVYLSFYQDYCGLAVIDCDSGKVLLLRDDVEHLWFDGDDFYAAKTNDTVFGNDIYFGDLASGTGYQFTAETLGSDTVSYRILSDSGYMVLHTVDEENLRTTLYDLSGRGASCELEQFDYQTSLLSPIYLEQEQLILGLWPDGYYFSLVLLDPKAMTFKASTDLQSGDWGDCVDQRLLSLYRNEAEGPSLPEQLKTQRERADALEETYGVRILMGEQIVSPCGDYAQTAEDPTAIDGALTQLEAALSQYPSGFAAQFRNGIREEGLYICLTGRIEGELMPVGQTRRTGQRYDLAIDITADGIDRTFHHEMWHAIEMKLSTDSFAHPQWDACNPSGFHYYGSYDSGYGASQEYTVAQSGAAASFIDAYAKINGTEDRARLMESVMSGDGATVLQSQTLRQKLDIMSKAIRDHFDTTGWQTPFWEQYL